jgi:hypothetical protein
LKLKQKPYHLLLLAAILLFVAGLFCFSSVIDVHIHHTYYVFPLTYFIWLPASILLIIWLIYLIAKNMLVSKTLSWTHVILTIVGCIFLLSTPCFMTNSDDQLAGMPRHYHDIGQSKTYKYSGGFTKSGVILGFFLVAGQLTFLLNLFIGLYRRLNRQVRQQH